jgi:hypothetical protein
MNKLISFFKSLLTAKGEWSVKRLIGLTGFISLIVVMFLERTPNAEVINAVEYIVIAALFGTSIDHFIFKPKQNNEEITNQGSEEGN